MVDQFLPMFSQGVWQDRADLHESHHSLAHILRYMDIKNSNSQVSLIELEGMIEMVIT